MKRLGMVWAVVMISAMCAAQMTAPQAPGNGADPHAGMQGAGGSVQSSRGDFGMECGIADSSPQSALRVIRSAEGEWSAASPEMRLGPTNSAVARVWHERNWMVDMHESPGTGMTTMHTGQMCFDAQGRITLMIDRYMEMMTCRCMRFTLLAFATDGRATRRVRRFVNASSGTEIEEPAVAGGFPEVWSFRKVEQLPFYPLVKK